MGLFTPFASLILQETSKKKKDIIKWGAEAGVTFAGITTDALSFASDYVGRKPEVIGQFSNNPIIGALTSGINNSDRVSQTWKQALSFAPNEMDKGLTKIKQSDYIKPSDEYLSSSLAEKFSPDLIGETLFHTSSDVAGSMAGYLINPYFGALTQGGAVAQDMKEIARKEGVSEDYSDALAITTGLTVGLIDKFVPDEILSPKAKQELVGGIAKRLSTFSLKATQMGVKEGITESLQENIQMAAEITMREIGVDEIVERNVMSAFGGLMGGSGMQSLKTVYDYANTADNKQKLKDLPMGFSIKDVSKRFEGFEDLSTKILSKLEGRDFVSKQFVEDMTNSADVKQVERELFREVLKGMDGNQISVQELADIVKSELLPLSSTTSGKHNTRDPQTGLYRSDSSRYEGVTLPNDLRGPIANYSERVYQSPIKTSAGDIHFKGDNVPNYFGHTRTEDTIDNVRRLIEVQSDLFQKGRLEEESFGGDTFVIGENEYIVNEILPGEDPQIGIINPDGTSKITFLSKLKPEIRSKIQDPTKLQPYRNTWFQRMIREEVKRAAQDSKNSLLLPTGETAMKVEGLGGTGTGTFWFDEGSDGDLTPNDLKVGKTLTQGDGDPDGMAAYDEWVITEVLGDGKFKAIPSDRGDFLMVDDELKQQGFDSEGNEVDEDVDQTFVEQFDISGKIDEQNPIFRFYEKEVQKFLKREYPNMEVITDERGVTWYKVPLTEDMGKSPILAFMRDTGQTRYVTREQAVKVVNEYTSRLKITNAETQLADFILTNTGGAFASTFGNNITFVEGLPRFAADHEMIHLVVKNIESFDIFKKDGITRKTLLDEMKEKYPDVTNEYELEERLAEEFEKFVEFKVNNTNTSIFGKLESFFQKFYDLFKRMFNIENKDATQRFFRFVYEDKNSAPVVLSNADQTGYARVENGKIIMDFSKLSVAQKEQKDLLAVHNLTEGNLKFADRLGGLANPSLAIFDPNKADFESFGEITLIGRKEFVEQGKMFAADVYTPRFPRTTFELPVRKLDEIRTEFKETIDLLKDGEDEPYGKEFYDETSPHNSLLLKTQFLLDKGVVPDIKRYDAGEDGIAQLALGQTRNNISKQIEESDFVDEYNQFVEKFLEDFEIEGEMFSHFTKTGTKKIVPLTLENASKIMKKEGLKGAEGFFYGLGSIRALLMPQLRSISKLKSMKEMLVSKDEFETIKAENDALFDEIIDELGIDGARDLGDYMAGKTYPGFDFIDFYKVSNETVKKIAEFKEVLKKTPTEYFEAKFTRPVMLNEFAYAIVPKNISKKTREILNQNNLEVIDYEDGNRTEAIKGLQDIVNTPYFKKIDPEELVELKEKTSQMLREFKASERASAIQVEIGINQEAVADLNENVVKGIKNNSYFRAEKDIKDDTGDGYLMRNNKGRHIVVEAVDRDTYLNKGYRVIMEIDSLAHAAGYESGYDYLLDQLDLSQLPTSFDRATEVALRRENAEYDSLKFKLENYKAALKGQKVTREIHLTELGKMQRTKFRRSKVSAILDYFELNKAQIKLLNRKDVGRMTDSEFDQFLYDIENRAVEVQETSSKKSQLMDLIRERDFRNFSALRRAMELPPISQMSTKQMDQFISALEPYQQGDYFLPQRKLETVERTKLGDVKTLREIREKLVEEANNRYGTQMSIDDLKKIAKSDVLDKFKGDVTLAEKNILFDIIVRNYHAEMAKSEVKLTQVENEFNKKVRKARKSRQKTVGDWIAPQDKKVVQWLEAKDEQKRDFERDMTPEELDLAQYMRTKYKEAYDYLVKMHYLHKGIENYYTHIRRGFLETAREDGIFQAFREVFKQQDLDVETFSIISDDTGSILPLEKFLPYLMKRTGEVVPTQNVAKSFSAYINSFARKTALDSVVPLVDMYTYAVEPKKTTEKGLQMDRSLRKFVNEWLNNKRGRKFSYGGVVVPGGKVDAVLRGAKMFTTLLYIGGSPITGAAAFVGEQSVTFTALGAKKFTKGNTRRLTVKGRKLINKYESFVGRGLFETLRLPDKDIGNKLVEGSLGMFRVASRTANITWFLGSLTKEEFESGEVSPESLTRIKLDMGRYKPISEFKSLLGATSVGGIATQFKSWAIPVANTIILRNSRFVLKNLKSGRIPIHSREMQELIRGTLLVAGIWFFFGAMVDEDDNTVLGQLKKKAYKDGMTLLQALSPETLFATPVVADTFWDLTTNITDIITMERYASTGNLKGLERLKKQFTPAVVKQLTPEEKTTTSSRDTKNPFGKSSNPFEGSSNPFKGSDNPFKSAGNPFSK